MNVEEAVKIVLDGLTGDNSLDVQIRATRRGLDRDLLRQVLNAMDYLGTVWKNQPSVPKIVAGAFVDIGSRLESKFYPENEQSAIRAAGRQVVACAYNLFDPGRSTVMVSGDRLQVRDTSVASANSTTAASEACPTVERESVDFIFDALVGCESIPVMLRDGRGVDAEIYDRTISSIAYLTEAWQTRSEVPKKIGIAFVDIWNLWHLSIGSYMPRERERVQSKAIELQEVAEGLLCPH